MTDFLQPSTPIFKIKRTPASVALGIPLPAYQSAGAAGLDLYYADDCGVFMEPGDRQSLPTGIHVEIQHGYVGLVRGRSGLAFGRGILAFDGTVDADFRGEVRVLLYNVGSGAHEIFPGDRIAQLVIMPVAHVELIEADELGGTARGDGGLGSTGS